MKPPTFSRGRRTALAAGAAAVAMLAPAVPDAAAEAGSAPPDPIVGFVRSPDGDYRTIAFPRAATSTLVFGNNNHGQIVGAYDDAAGRSHGFVRSPNGRYRTIDFPGAYATVATRINDRGQIVGDYFSTRKRYNQGLKRGYLLDHGHFTRINVPGSDSTEAVGLDDRGRVVGETLTLKPLDGSGYVWKNGRIRLIDVPRAGATGAEEINERGQIAGSYYKDLNSERSRGYLLDRGRFRTFAVRGGRLTQVFGLNNRGQIVGYTADDLLLNNAHGYLLPRGPGGPVKRIDVPGAVTTLAFGLNDRGQVVGTYERLAAMPETQRPLAAGTSLLDTLPLGLLPGDAG